MHLVTGFILANLFGRKKKPGRSPLLSLQYPIRTQHLLPGRVRFQSNVLKGDEKGREFLSEQLVKVKGVTKLDVNTISGSVLIHFSEDEIQPELLYTVLIRLLGLEKELEKAPKSIVFKEIRTIGDSLNRAVYERTGGIIDLWTAIPIVMALVGARAMMTRRAFPFPTGFNMLWWAYQSLFREK